jgi:trehalose 6-phosphate phosphatase
MRSLFRDWSNVKRRLSEPSLALFLDFDGTLSPIVKDPDRAAIPARTRKTISRLAGMPGVYVAIVSGRALADVRRRVRIQKAAYAGNHGLEIEGPGFRLRLKLPAGYRKALVRVLDRLIELPPRFPGTELEDKGLTLSFHYRRAERRIVPAVRSAFRDAVRPYLDRLEIRTGKRILEVRPPIPWGKGEAVLWLLAERRWMPSIVRPQVVYIGDDRTDEDAFFSLHRRGLSIRVGRSVRSAARYYVADVEAAGRFLDRLIRLRKGL